jgi:hypothetical protein
MKNRWNWVAGLLALTACIGCGSGDGRMAVRGEVTLNGTALSIGHIAFEPTSNQGVSSGALIRDGLYTIPAEQGLVPGEYLVRIYSSGEAQTGGPVPTPEQLMGGNVPPPPKELIPAEYNVKSTQKATVSAEGSNAFDFKIQTK